MDPFKTLYFNLFNSMTDAIDALDAMNFGKAKEILIAAQQNAEERYLSQEQPDR